MKIIVDSAIPFIKDRISEEAEVVYLPGNSITPEIIKDADAMIIRTRTKCDEKLLRESNVKLIVTATIGTDHIDMGWCEDNGIKVCNAPGCNAPGVAQYVLTSLFESGFSPEKHTLGIIGYGHVGSIVADWAREMGIKTLVYDPPKEAEGNCDIQFSDLTEVLENSDAVTLHVPLTKDGNFPTFHMIGEKEIGLMKTGSVLVNSSRGGVVDEEALKRALKDKKINAITDVWESEPDIDRDLLMLSSIATPHIAGYSYEGKKRATRMSLEAIGKYLGVPVNISGLECVPHQDLKVSKDMITESYNPLGDSERLKNSPWDFEKFRNQYDYRHEPLFANQSN